MPDRQSEVHRFWSAPLGSMFVGAILAIPICWMLFGNFYGAAFWLAVLTVVWLVRAVRSRATADELIPREKRCRHQWTTIPPRTIDLMRQIKGERWRLPDAYVGSTVAPWCVKCRVERNTGARYDDGPLSGFGIATPDPERRLAETVGGWLNDDRPAFETVEALERDVERVLRGDLSAEPVSQMPLRPRTRGRK